MTDISSNILQKTNAKRLIKDITDIYKDPLENQGIYYKHDTDNMLKGYAMIIGPQHGLYANGIYFFKFNYPVEYPFSPPIVEYCTNDGGTRFHPNLYRQGKVCLSILNTWQGDSWTACQSIRSVLLQLLLLFHNKPLLNEPGITETHRDFENYHKIIEYKNYDYSIYYQNFNKQPSLFHMHFDDAIQNHLKSNIDNILAICSELVKIYPIANTITTSLYNMRITINYKLLVEKLLILKERF